jgi:hypothetical protein
MPLSDASSRLRQWVRREPALVARLMALVICAAISHVSYLAGTRDWGQQVQVMSILGLWAVACLLCQRAVGRQRGATLGRFVWAGADVVFLTAALHIVDALESPLVAVYQALIVGSGLWFQVSLVRFTTQLCSLGYIWLLAFEYWRIGSLPHLRWHLIFLVVLAITGFMVAYYVHRVSILGRYCDSRSSSS